jgi:parallel beta-helix repeat protein
MIDLTNSEVDFTNCIVRLSDQNGIQYLNSTGSLIGSQITDNLRDGIRTQENANPSITSNTIKGNSGFGISNLDQSIVVNATNNYWGDPSGPYDNENLDTLNLLNPIRTGDSVSEFVDWSDPLSTEPSPLEIQSPTIPELPPIPGQEQQGWISDFSPTVKSKSHGQSPRGS